MGFWQSLGRIVAGKPVYDETSVSDRLYSHPDQTQPSKQSAKAAFIDAHGNKIVPEVSFKHFKSYINGPKVTTRAWAVNDSQFELELTKTELLGHHQNIHRRLKPGESHEVMVYDGPVLTHEHDHRAHLYYKIHENDDYFVAEYSIEYHRESSGVFTIEEFHRNNQPRDI